MSEDSELEAEQPRRRTMRSCLTTLVAIVGLAAVAYWARDIYLGALWRSIMSQEDIARGYACTDFDGSVRHLTWAIKDRLADPGSYDHVGTSFLNPNETDNELLKKGDMLITARFRARNAQGGMEFENAYAKLDPQTCEVGLIEISPDGSGTP